MPIKLVFRPAPDAPRYPYDVERIVSVLAGFGYEVSEVDAKLAWEAYSDDFCCGWHVLPRSDTELYQTVLPYLTREQPA